MSEDLILANPPPRITSASITSDKDPKYKVNLYVTYNWRSPFSRQYETIRGAKIAFGKLHNPRERGKKMVRRPIGEQRAT